MEKTQNEMSEKDIMAILEKPKRSRNWDSEALIGLMTKTSGLLKFDDIKSCYHGESYQGYKNSESCLMWAGMNVLNRHFDKVGKGKARALYKQNVLVYSKSFMPKN